MSRYHVGMPQLLRISGLRFQYGGAAAEALRGIDLELHGGGHTLLMGPTGAGKTTFCCGLRGLLATLIDGTLQGEIHCGDTLVAPASGGTHHVATLSSQVGLVFQDFERQLFSTTVVREVAFGPENLGLPSLEIRSRVDWALDLVGLGGYESRAPATLSGGEKQRLAIASVLALRPRILILDEPTTDLDPAGKESVYALRERLASEVELFVMAEHEIEPALSFERIMIMAGGRLVADGGRELLFQPRIFETNAVQPYEPAAIAAEIGMNTTDVTAVGQAVAGRLSPGQPSVPRASVRPEREAVSLTGVGFSYGASTILEDFTLSIGEGEFVALLGHNGCGKTTMAKLMAGLLRPSHGTVRLLGEDMVGRGFGWIATRAGYVFQNPDHQIFASTIGDELSFGPRNLGLDASETARRVDDVIGIVGLDELRGADPFTLPKGYRQMVAVASVLVMQPRLLILDEPTTGLDLSGRRAILELLQQLNGAGHTILIITHSMRAALEYATRTVVMKNGRIIADGPSEEVFYGAALEAAGLRAPPIVAIGKAAGVRVRSAAELLRMMR
ncbi:MAG: ATP-binding cassette domain-containing protein [Acidobacteria bacterium]|nr:ATP-binding cassette domain-containing protein [Acidobacteriota bacterium]